MKLIDQSVEYWGLCPVDLDRTLKRIERAARTCFTPDTEILTEAGWKLLGDVSPEERVLTYNPGTNVLEYQVSNMFHKKYNGDLIVFEHRLCKLALTPDHRVYCRRPYTQGNERYGFVRADQVKERYGSLGCELPRRLEGARLLKSPSPLVRIEMPSKTSYGGRPLKEMVVEGKDFLISDAFLVLVAAYISDGHLKYANRGVIITKKSGDPLIKAVQGAVQELGWSATMGKSAGRAHIVSLSVTGGGSPVGDWFEVNCGRGSLNKRLPEFWRELSIAQMRVLWEALLLGDGNITKEGRASYRSSSLALIEQLSEMLTLLGDSATICTHKIREEGKSWTKNPHYTLYISKRPHLVILPAQVKTTTYTGDVFCPQTENGIVCVRREGRIVWTGNCYRSEPKEDSAEQFVAKRMAPEIPHSAIMEHSNIVGAIKIPPDALRFMRLSKCWESRWITQEVKDDTLYVYGNLRAFMEQINTRDPKDVYYRLESAGFILIPPENQPRHMQRVTVKLITDRAILAEITRHRNDVGFCVQSQRYVDYLKEILYVKPSWYAEATGAARDFFYNSCIENEKQYRRLREYGLPPQHARVSLNNQTATEIVMTAYLPQWDFMFKLRRAPGAYPQMIDIMDEAHTTFLHEGHVV